jgi:glycine/D-amino acid oxidase-like deaminating enzyme
MAPDVIVIGGGLAGTALTYALARAGVDVLLLERGRLAGEASGATMGMALWIGMQSKADIAQAAVGFERLPTLAEELDADLHFRRLPSLVLAPNEAILVKLGRQAEHFRQAGLPAKIVDPAEMADLEPALDPGEIAGGLYAEQGHLDGAALTLAYAEAARRLGAKIREHSPVQGFEVENNRVTAVQTEQETLSAGQVVVAAGAWSRALAASIGLELPIYHLHGQAVATVPLSLRLNCMVMVARPDGYSGLERWVATSLAEGGAWEEWTDDSEAVDTSVVQLADGRVLLGQVSRAAPVHRISLEPAAVTKIQAGAGELIPILADVPLQRSWIAPVSFTSTQEPMVGSVSGWENLFVCAGFKSILITAPIACEALARQIVNGV